MLNGSVWFHKISLDGKSLGIGLSFQGAPGGMGPVELNHVLGPTETDSFLWRRSGDIIPLSYQVISSVGTLISSFWALSQTIWELTACSRLQNIPDFILEQVMKIIIWWLWTWNHQAGTVCKRNFLQKLWEGLEETYSRSQIVLTFIFLQFSFLGSDSLT